MGGKLNPLQVPGFSPTSSSTITIYGPRHLSGK